MKMLALIASIAVLPLSPVQAGPDSTTNFLMDTSASLMDLGITRLEASLRNSEIDASVSFIWDKNEISISGFMSEGGVDLDAAKGTCDVWFKKIRSRAGIDNTTGKVNSFFETSIFSDYFGHSGYKLKNEAEDWKTDLDKKFSLIFIHAFEDGGNFKWLRCSAPLLSTGFSEKIQ
jgi:hypothetical protein